VSVLQQDSTLLLYRVEGDEDIALHLPQYYREGFFSKDSLFHPELRGGRYGTAGDPVPYSAHSDHVITSLLLACFILTVIAFSTVRGFIVRQVKSLFYTPHEGTTEVFETAGEVRALAFLVLIDGLMLSLLYYFYVLQKIGDVFVLESQYLLIVIFLAVILACFLVRAVCYALVNSVFFDGKRNRQWMKSLLFLLVMECFLLFPAVIVQTYFDLSVENVERYFIVVLFFVKILTFYKCYVIFFSRNVFNLQIILYFCALELVPLLALWHALGITTNSLIINF